MLENARNSALFTIILLLGCLLQVSCTGAPMELADFCDPSIQAAPERSTVVYLDRALLQDPELAEVWSNEDDDDAVSEVGGAIRDKEWFVQISNNLSTSLLPSERVSLVALLPKTGRARNVASEDLCWPDYTEEIMAEKADADSGGLRGVTSKLEDTRQKFSNAMADAVAELYKPQAKGKAADYIKSLSSDVQRLQGDKKQLRVIVYAKVENGVNLKGITTEADAITAARKLALQTNLRMPRAHFYIYGVGYEKLDVVNAFWDEFLHQSRAYLTSFDTDLPNLEGKPTHFVTLNLGEIKIKDAYQELVRTGKARLTVTENGALQDSSLVVVKEHLVRHHTAISSGTFSCGEWNENICNSGCELTAVTDRLVNIGDENAEIWGDNENIKLEGTGNNLNGLFWVENKETKNPFNMEVTAAYVEGCGPDVTNPNPAKSSKANKATSQGESR